MTLQQHYQPDVARKYAEVTRQLHCTAWADLWAQGVPFFSPALAFYWRAYRQEILTFWQPLGDDAMTTQLRLQMDDLIRQDDALKATHQRAEYNQWAADHADELYEGWLDARYEDWAAQQESA